MDWKDELGPAKYSWKTPSGYRYPFAIGNVTLDKLETASAPGIHNLSFESRVTLARAKLRGDIIASRFVKRGA